MKKTYETKAVDKAKSGLLPTTSTDIDKAPGGQMKLAAKRGDRDEGNELKTASALSRSFERKNPGKNADDSFGLWVMACLASDALAKLTYDH